MRGGEFNLSFSTDNAAFRDEADGDADETADEAIRRECARILRDIADSLDAGNDQGRARDLNGNGVGHWRLTDD